MKTRLKLGLLVAALVLTACATARYQSYYVVWQRADAEHRTLSTAYGVTSFERIGLRRVRTHADLEAAEQYLASVDPNVEPNAVYLNIISLHPLDRGVVAP